MLFFLNNIQYIFYDVFLYTKISEFLNNQNKENELKNQNNCCFLNYNFTNSNDRIITPKFF